MSQVSDIMWYLSFSDSSSSEIISWLWVETLHTQLSLSLSLPPSPIQGPHMYTKIMGVKITVVFFLGGGFVLPEKPCFLDTQMNTKYVK